MENKVFFQLLLLAVGVFLLTAGSNATIDALNRISNILRMPKQTAGSIILGLATSFPEIVVTLDASLQGTIDLAMGNALGSYVTNIGFVTGICALIRPIRVNKHHLHWDIPCMGASLILTILLVLNGMLHQYQGLLLLTALAAYLLLSSYQKPQTYYLPSHTKTATSPLSIKQHIMLWLLLVVSVASLIAGAELMVSSATKIAILYQIPDLYIGLTVIAFGTSLPELATTITAVVKHENEIAFGNIIGSSIYCLLLIFSIPLLCSQTPISSETLWLSFMLMSVITFIFWLFCAKFDQSPTINRLEGVGLLTLYGLYHAALLHHIPKISSIIR